MLTIRLRSGRSALAALTLAALFPTTASAGVFDVKGADIEKGEREVGINSTLQRGFPENADRTRGSLEVGVGWAPADWFKLGAKINMDRPEDESWQASTAGAEIQFAFGQPIKGVSLGWFTGIDGRIDRDETNTVVFGPIFQFGDEKRSLAVNPFLERSFGKNSETGTTFSYGWQVKRELRQGFAVGVEGYGSIPNIADAPPSNEQEHRIGPVVYFDGDLTRAKDGPKWAIEFGGFVGLTDATPDTSGKLKAAITF